MERFLVFAYRVDPDSIGYNILVGQCIPIVANYFKNHTRRIHVRSSRGISISLEGSDAERALHFVPNVPP